ncbi:MAG: hypothetical protein WCF49_22445, partial [Xanthobacteraceae bacterium]
GLACPDGEVDILKDRKAAPNAGQVGTGQHHHAVVPAVAADRGKTRGKAATKNCGLRSKQRLLEWQSTEKPLINPTS